MAHVSSAARAPFPQVLLVPPPASWHQMTPGYAQTATSAMRLRNGVPKASCLCRTRDLSFDCLVFLLGCETEICPCLFCFLLSGGCSIIWFSFSQGSSAGVLLAPASYRCSAMKSEVPQTSRGPLALALLCSSGQQQLLNSSAANTHYHFSIIKQCCLFSSLDYHSKVMVI